MPTMSPCLAYRDAPAAIAWLEKAFGFKTVLLVPGDTHDVVAHSELALGDDIIMVYTAHENDPMGMRSPRDLAGVNQALYLVADDVDARFERAVAAGAEVVREPTDEPYGGRDWVVKDPEGHHWSFGTYRPGTHTGG